jgi:hypothetical protein
MKNIELIGLLTELAELDLSDKADIYDHPCSVAVREIRILEQMLRDVWESPEIKALAEENAEYAGVSLSGLVRSWVIKENRTVKRFKS